MTENNGKLYSEIEVNLDEALAVGLTKEEYEKVVEYLGRTPTYTELGVYGVMWSEHCSYKNSIKQLKTLPRSGGKLLVDAGEENAGLVDIGGGYAISFKIESHNHPSAVEPVQGAATGVGGILRDIFSMGARPIAALNSLRFGELDNERTKFLFRGVVKGIGSYGNSFGVPTVGGEVYFQHCYHGNPLVNAMAVGIVATEKTASAVADGPGNPVMIVGSATGRDGIHGASLLASREFTEEFDTMRSTVQVGDPFAEKLLLEATLELIEADVLVGVQDMGAAGISCTTSEMSARKENIGMNIDLDKVPLREKGMTAYEIMLSESQERMLFVLKKDKVDEAVEICNKWEVPITQIGEVNKDGNLHIWHQGKKVCDMNAWSLVLGGGAPQYDREAKEPDYLKETRNFDFSALEYETPNDRAFWNILKSPTAASKKWVFDQYDSQVRTNTVSYVGDAAVMRLKELPGKGIAASTDCNSRYVYLDPYKGAVAAVMEAARNVVCTGAEPIAITNCLNFGNPYDPQLYWQFKEAVRGMGDACRALDTPVTGGNVSFHNESHDSAIYPTPVIGMLGMIEDLDKTMSAGFKDEGDIIYLIGNEREELGGSEYLKSIHGLVAGQAPDIDIDEELKLQKYLLWAIQRKLVNSAHDCSEGGIAICLAEKSILSKENNIGVEVDLGDEPTPGRLFGESQSRVIVSVSRDKAPELEKLLEDTDIYYEEVGRTVKDKFEIKNCIKSTCEEIYKEYENAIPEIMELG